MALYNIPIGFKIFSILICISEMTHLQGSHIVVLKLSLRLVHKKVPWFYFLPIAYLFTVKLKIKVLVARVT